MKSNIINLKTSRKKHKRKPKSNRTDYICKSLPDVDPKIVKKILERDDEYFDIQTHAFSCNVTSL